MEYKVRILIGHTTPETAYLVADYPYGFKLRCQIRYWVETATTGQKRGQMRFMSQTSNPQREGVVWNSPKASTYGTCLIMFLNKEDHVKYMDVDPTSNPAIIAKVQTALLPYPKAPEVTTLARIAAFSKKYYPAKWEDIRA